jgi:CheY-like chemotaxis protein
MPKSSVIMLVDDSPDDLELMRIAFKKAGIRNPIAEVHSGEQAIAYLTGEDKYGDRRHFPLPCLIVTDLKMPGVDGFELLKWLRDQPAFELVPKIVLTASAHEEDKQRARELGCTAYFTKPNQLEGLVNLVDEMNTGWISQYCPVPS